MQTSKYPSNSGKCHSQIAAELHVNAFIPKNYESLVYPEEFALLCPSERLTASGRDQRTGCCEEKVCSPPPLPAAQRKWLFLWLFLVSLRA